MSRSLFILIIVFCSTLSGSAATTEAPDSLLASYIREAVSHHPEVLMAREDVSAVRSRSQMNGAWMNPDLRLGLMNLPTSFDTHMDASTMWQVGIMQKVPFPGKRTAAKSTNEARVGSSEAQARASENDLAQMTAMAYYDLAMTLAARPVILQGRELAERVVTAVESSLRSGSGTLSSVASARAERLRWEEMLVRSQAEEESQRSALAYALGRESLAGFSDPVLPDALPSVELDSISSETPASEALRLQALALKREADQARLDYKPDITFGLTYGFRGYLREMMVDPITMTTSAVKTYPDNMLSFEVSLPLPIFAEGNQGARIGESEAMSRSLAFQQQRLELSNEQAYRRLTAELEGSRSRIELLTRLEAQYADLWQATLTDYQAGKASYDMLSDAQMKLIDAKMEIIQLRASMWQDYWQRLAIAGKAYETVEK